MADDCDAVLKSSREISKKTYSKADLSVLITRGFRSLCLSLRLYWASVFCCRSVNVCDDEVMWHIPLSLTYLQSPELGGTSST